jgi:hypothetical protein
VDCGVQLRGAHLLGALEAELEHNSKQGRWLLEIKEGAECERTHSSFVS